jgi:hypothetical protein
MRLRFWGICALPALSLSALGCERSPSDQGPRGGAGGPPDVPLSCDVPNAGPAPLHPLTRFQYDNAVRDLLGDTSHPAAAFPPENEVDGYRTYASANVANPLLVESYLSAAEAIAARAAAERIGDVAPCAAGEDEATCGHAFAAAFAARAFRRPATEAELHPLQQLFDSGHQQGYAKGVELVVQAVLQSPQFLYRVDGLKSPTVETGAIALGGYELAGRLSFALWGSVPDAELLAAAGEGRLTTAADVEREARRLLDDQRARDIVRDFSEQWLGLSRLDGAVREGAEVEPTVLSRALRHSLDQYLSESYFGPAGTFERLFTSPQVWVNATLSPLYGGTASAADFEPQMMPDPRAGLLTQPGMMALLSHSDQSAPVIRGVFVRERILCETVPPPPPSVNAVAPDPDPNATTRERFRQHTEQEACSGCHKMIDGIGFGFERYDQLGRYRAVENGLDVDESGNVVGFAEEALNGPFAGAVELSARIAGSAKARDCLAANWYRYTYGRQEVAEDSCSLAQVQERFRSSEGSLKELLVALTQTDAFLYRPAIAGGTP